MKRLAWAAIAFLAMGCGGDDDDDSGNDYTISEDDLSGTVGGEAWSFVAGATDAFLSEGDGDFFTSMWAEEIEDECGFTEPEGKYLFVSVPKTEGEYEFTTTRNMTFVVGPADNLVSFEGKVVVDSVTETKVTGGLYGIFDEDNEVSGQFELTLCTDE